MAEVIIRPFHRYAQISLIPWNTHGARRQILQEGRRGIAERHAILRPLRPRQGGFNRAEVKFQRIGKHRIGHAFLTEHALRLEVFARQVDAMFVTARQAQIFQRRVIHREEAAGRAIFGRHIADGRTIRERQMRQTRAEEFNKLADHALLAEHLRDRQHQIGSGDTFLHRTGQLEADDIGDEHGNRLAEHGGFRFNPAHTPAQHAKAIDHGGVAIRAIAGIGEGKDIAGIRRGPHHLRQVFQIHLVADTRARRHNAEIIEGFLAPAEEFVTLPIPLKLNIHILLERGCGAGDIHHHRMVNHEVHRHQRVHLARVSTQAKQGIAHGGKVHHGGDAGEILEQDARRAEGHFLVGTAILHPFGDLLRVIHRIGTAIFEAQHIFQQHLEAIGQAGKVADALRCLGQAEIMIGLAVNTERATSLQAVLPDHPHG